MTNTINTIITQNSTYEVDRENRRIRRVKGKNPPTDAFLPEGEWKDYEELTQAFDGSLFGPVVYWGGSRFTFLSQQVTDPLSE